MVNYLAKFTPNLAETTAPMRNLLKKDSEFVWDCMGLCSNRKGDVYNSVTYWHVRISIYCMLYFVYAYLGRLAHYANLEKHTHPRRVYEQAE